MQNQLTIRGIARLGGVGKSAISRVLNNEGGVNEQTRERIEAVMQQHGFSPSRSVRAMRSQNDKVVAVIITRLDSLSESLAMQAVLLALYKQGYDPIMMESQFSPGLVEKHPGMLAQRNIDGVMLFGFAGIDETILAPWRDMLVLMARDTPGFASVCYDDKDAITLLVQQLYGRGHRHVSFLGVPHSDITTGKRRCLVYLVFCKRHRLTPTAALLGLGMEQGYDTVVSMLTAGAGTLVCAADTLTLGTSKYLQQQGRATLQLVSVSITPLIRSLHPGISTVDPGCAESGRRAVQQLIEQIADSVEPRQIVTPTVLN